jgi:preprotein translocase subunit SecD
MQKNLRLKFIFILAIMAICAYFFVSPLEKGSPLFSRVNLGLDLQGGIHLVLRVVTDEALDQTLLQEAAKISNYLTEQNISFDSAKKGSGNSIEVTGVDSSRDNEFRPYLDSVYGGGQYTIRSSSSDGKTNFTLSLTNAEIRNMRESTVQQALETIRRRVDALGVSEPSLQLYGSSDQEVQDQIIVELPGIDDPERVKDLIANTAQLRLSLVKKENGGPFASVEAAWEANAGEIPDQYEVLPYLDDRGNQSELMYLIVSKTPVITGKDLKTARRGVDSNGNPAVDFFLKAAGAKNFADVTGKHVGENLAIILDDVVNSQPVINSQIEAEGIIQGSFTIQRAEDLALLLRSGALPASLEREHEQIVGASLGNDSIRSGIMASMIGFGLVVLGMVIYYRRSGLNAVWCLLGNLIVLMGFMGAVGATLTLPGIAGVILTIGMAVDSNILIFERIREELRGGKTVRAAIDTGFGKVFWTIFDTHITTLIAAAFLFQFGTGPIRGFAITLTVGLIANMFTAVYVSHRLFELMLGDRRVEVLSI